MKNILYLSIFAIAISLMGCSNTLENVKKDIFEPSESQKIENERRKNTEERIEKRFTNEDLSLKITTDLETGCKYIIFYSLSSYSGAGGITPLMLSDGTQDCSGDTTKEEDSK